MREWIRSPAGRVTALVLGTITGTSRIALASDKRRVRRRSSRWPSRRNWRQLGGSADAGRSWRPSHTAVNGTSSADHGSDSMAVPCR